MQSISNPLYFYSTSVHSIIKIAQYSSTLCQYSMALIAGTQQYIAQLRNRPGYSNAIEQCKRADQTEWIQGENKAMSFCYMI